MSRAFSWLSAALSPAQVLAALNLEDTGTAVGEGEGEIAGAPLPQGGYVVAANAFWHALIHPAKLSALSLEASVVGCAESENANASTAFLWQDGRQVWQITHLLDQGAEHLETEGEPPRETAALLKQAIARHRAEGHDAVYGVPAAVAKSCTGFRYGENRGLRFTRLVPRKGAVVANGTQITFGWPNDRDELTATLGRALEAILIPLGFEVRQARGGDDFVQTRDDTTLTICGVGYDDPPFFTCDVLISVRQHTVERLVASVIPQHERSSTCDLRLASIEGRGGFDIKSLRHIEAFIKFLGKKLPVLVERCSQVRELDRLVNGDRSRIDGIDFLSAEGPIVLAWLAGNPNFDSMVAYADSRYDRRDIEGDTPIVQLAEHLRRCVPVK
ncbi:hypothetical protein [Tahibacter harae]|uniref:Uncharacterized protein n=1 Tax=Tahibacter harae TaxID=2963937 RepID=A0ABT1QLX5_9GAMM|nr:hypothetical protein [Tahibacter harae]MCQ4163521.1 hypothetical protein [Tahibacter harae]